MRLMCREAWKSGPPREEPRCLCVRLCQVASDAPATFGLRDGCGAGTQRSQRHRSQRQQGSRSLPSVDPMVPKVHNPTDGPPPSSGDVHSIESNAKERRLLLPRLQEVEGAVRNPARSSPPIRPSARSERTYRSGAPPRKITSRGAGPTPLDSDLPASRLSRSKPAWSRFDSISKKDGKGETG